MIAEILARFGVILAFENEGIGPENIYFWRNYPSI
jgi:hypothetical protein